MRLLRDDLNQIYVWVDDIDESIRLSPSFDYEEDADKWYQDMMSHFKKQ